MIPSRYGGSAAIGARICGPAMQFARETFAAASE